MTPVRVACVGIGWWSGVLADAIHRGSDLKIVACATRSPGKRESAETGRAVPVGSEGGQR